MNVILVDQSNLEDFVAMARALYEDRPLWRSQPYETVEQQLARFGSSSDVVPTQRFVCYEGVRCIGRLTAIVDQRGQG